MKSFVASFTGPFWVANLSELFERLAFYGTTAMLVVYLTESRGFERGEAMRLNGVFGMLVYGLPVLSGFIADLLGYRRALLLAYALLGTGYLLVAQLSGYWPIAGALLVIALGASLVKPTITGTVQKTCGPAQRAIGFSVYYTLVNVGGMLGPTAAGKTSDTWGSGSNFLLSAAAAGVALLLIAAFFRGPAAAAAPERKSIAAFGRDFVRVVGNLRLMALFVLVAGFWAMFFALYGPLPLYLTEHLGASKTQLGLVLALESATIIALQVAVGALSRNLVAHRAFLIGVLLGAAGLAIMGLYPSVYVVGAGMFVLALGEITYSAHFYKYLGDMAPPDQVGMYMGFAFLPIALGYFASGYLGSAFDALTTGRPQLIWFAFAAVGVASSVGIYLLTEVFKPRKPAADGALQA